MFLCLFNRNLNLLKSHEFSVWLTHHGLSMCGMLACIITTSTLTQDKIEESVTFHINQGWLRLGKGDWGGGQKNRLSCHPCHCGRSDINRRSGANAIVYQAPSLIIREGGGGGRTLLSILCLQGLLWCWLEIQIERLIQHFHCGLSLHKPAIGRQIIKLQEGNMLHNQIPLWH